MRQFTIRMLLVVSGVVSSLTGCNGKGERQEVKKQKALAAAVPSPSGYDLGAPVKYVLGEILREISGITCLRGNPDTMSAIEDETGKLYAFHPGGGLHMSR